MSRWRTSSSQSFVGLKNFFASPRGRSIPYLIVAFWVALVLASVAGCGARTILVPEAAPVRVGPDTRARVYTRINNDWVLSDNRVQLQEGWYLVPPSFVEE